MNAATANLKVTKRDGRLEDINLDKIHRVITWAADGLSNVSVSQVELKSHIQFYNGIRTDDIHETIIKAAADLISQDTPDYQYLAARLAIFHLRKIAYGEYEPPHLFDHVSKLVDSGKYDKHLLEDYDRADYDALNAYIDHDRDLTFSYAAVKQLDGKYLLQNRVTRQIYETPQFLYVLVAMSLFANRQTLLLQLPEAEHDLRALGRRGVAPGREGGLGGVDGSLDGAAVGQLDLAHRLADGRVEDRRGALAAQDDVAVDQVGDGAHGRVLVGGMRNTPRPWRARGRAYQSRLFRTSPTALNRLSSCSGRVLKVGPNCRQSPPKRT